MAVIILKTKNHIYIRDGNKKYNVSPLPFSLKMMPTLKKRSTVIGFVGENGSGKSVRAASSLAMHQMLNGKDVYSNMMISFFQYIPNSDSLVERKSNDLSRIDLKDLAEIYQNAALYFDEINIGLGEARRSMSDINLKLAYIFQQKRKRGLDLAWSAVSEMDTDPRVRRNTDIFVECEDLSVKPGFRHYTEGVYSEVKYYDYSSGGLIVGKNKAGKGKKQSLFHTEVFWNKPWWNIYDTYQLQMPDGDTQDKNIMDMVNWVLEFIEQTEDGRVMRADVYRYLGIEYNQPTQRELLRYLSNVGVHTSTDIRRRYLIKDPDYVEVK